jgi:soluble lytic murein transglycosylase-like protein
MKKNTNIQPTGPADVCKRKKLNVRARIGMAAAGTGFAGALLLGGLFSGQAFAAPVQAQAPALAHTTRMSAAPMSAKTAHSTYWDIAWQAATYYGISPYLFERQINQESGFNPWALSPAGAEGIAQFMPATAASMGVNPWDPVSALWGAARLMAQLNNQFGNYAMALAAYNAGPGAVQYAINAGGNNWYYYLPYETQNYVSVIMGW